MIRTILSFALSGLAVAALPFASALAQAQPQSPPQTQALSLSLEQRTLLRCSAAFAIVARQQADGKAEAKRFPPMEPRGREFFIRAGAQLMDDAKLTREQVQAALQAEAAGLAAPGRLDAVMPACLRSLDASGL